jgi:hypothetical protein
MNTNGVAYQGYTTHDPDEAIQKYVNLIGEEPTIILIRPGFPVTKDHPLLLETKFCGHNLMMVSSDIDVLGYRDSLKKKEQQRRERKIYDAKLVWQEHAREQELERDFLDDTTYFQQEERKPPDVISQEEWIKPRAKVMTDKEYLNLMEKPGYIYLLSSDNGYHKIGRSVDVEDRRSQLEREIPVVIGIEYYFASKYYVAAEAYMHAKYERYRTGRYEWFKLGKKQLDDFKTFMDYDLDSKLEILLLNQR